MRRQTRRSFLRHAALGGAGLTILSNSGSARAYAANEAVHVALIGVGGRGRWFVDQMPKLANVVAMCDVNESKAAYAYKAHPDLPKFSDFRVMLDKMHHEIDGVIISTPDHTHASAALTAMKAGKHVFVEKPLCGCVHEARTMRRVAESQNVATQMGNQGSSGAQFRRGVELIQDGLLGEVREVYIWNSGGGADRNEPPQGEQAIPPYLNWDLWLGPVPERPFHASWLGWSQWRELGTGQIGMWGSHTSYLAFLALDLVSLWHAKPATQPRIKVRAEVSGINRVSFPRWEKVHFRIPARGDLPPVTIHWVNGGAAPGWKEKLDELVGDPADWDTPESQAKEETKKQKWSDFAGAVLLGSKGRMHSTGHNYTIDLLPTKQFADVDTSRPARLTNSHGMPEPDWLRVARGDRAWTAWSNFSNTGPYMEMLLLVNVATQFDEELEYDPLEGRIVNHAEADAQLRRAYRAGWAV